MKIGQSTHIHLLRGKALVELSGTRCFSCGKKIVLKVFETPLQFSWEGESYCSNCYQQVSHGIKLKEYTKSNWFRNNCKTCNKKIGRIYTHCWEHTSSNIKNTTKEEKRKLINDRNKAFGEVKPFDPYSKKKVLRNGYSQCQNRDCPDRKPMLKEQLLKRRLNSRTMFFCTQECFEESAKVMDW